MTPDTNQCQSASTVSQMHQQLAQMRLEIAAMVAEVESDHSWTDNVGNDIPIFQEIFTFRKEYFYIFHLKGRVV